jgi:hypothetical protein
MFFSNPFHLKKFQEQTDPSYEAVKIFFFISSPLKAYNTLSMTSKFSNFFHIFKDLE